MNNAERMSCAETGQYLGVHVTTLSRWRDRNVGPSYFLMGGRIFYRKSALEGYMQETTVNPGKDEEEKYQ